MALFFMAVLFAGLSISYMYFLATSVAYVSGREKLVEEARTISSEMATLESEYLSKSLAMTEPFAEAQGFVKSDNHAFVERADTLSIEQGR